MIAAIWFGFAVGNVEAIQTQSGLAERERIDAITNLLQGSSGCKNLQRGQPQPGKCGILERLA
jgi:hypothetical protein